MITTTLSILSLGLFCSTLLLLWLWIRSQRNLNLEQKNKQQLELEFQLLKERSTHAKETFEQTSQTLEDRFKTLASEALESQSKQFLHLAKATLETENQTAASELEKRKTAIDQLIQPLKTSLETYQKHLNTTEANRHRSYERVENELKRVIETNQTLSIETSALKKALTKPNVRGRWGELQLKNCIELAGMSEYADVTFQDHQTNDDGQILIPDMTVKMPGGRVVVVDAKTPIDAFMTSLESTEDQQRQVEIIRHGKHVKEHIKKLSNKGYAETLKTSADFILMFLPNESFLYAALETQPDLVEFALEKKVLIATPPTLVGLLKVIRLGWNEEKLAENAELISQVGSELHKRIIDFSEAFIAMGTALDRAKSEYDTSFSRLKSRVFVQAKRLEKLGAKSKKELPKKAIPDHDEVTDQNSDLTGDTTPGTPSVEGFSDPIRPEIDA